MPETYRVRRIDITTGERREWSGVADIEAFREEQVRAHPHPMCNAWHKWYARLDDADDPCGWWLRF